MGTLLPHHLADLKSSGLTDGTIARMGCHSESNVPMLMQRGFPYSNANGPALVIPYRFPGSSEVEYRIKPTKPHVFRDGKTAKYLTASGKPNRLYFTECDLL